jgi:succinate dehydrogenase / fumarate reductase flavoprotein subunit
MQGLADGYFVLPATITEYLADAPFDTVDDSHPAAVEALQNVQNSVQRMLDINGTRTPASFHRELGKLMWDMCGMERSEESLRKALDRIPEIRQEFWTNLKVTGDGQSFNQTLELAGRVADFIELAELMCVDALHRRESCGGHFRAESQTPDGEALRDDENFAYVAAWEWTPENEPPVLHKEDLEYEYVHLAQRSYK